MILQEIPVKDRAHPSDASKADDASKSDDTRKLEQLMALGFDQAHVGGLHEIFIND